MSTHYICFYGELMKRIFQLLSNTHFICYPEVSFLPVYPGKQEQLKFPTKFEQPLGRL